MAAELPRPGVEILQEFRTVSPTVITPRLIPNVVGVAKQIVDLLIDDGSGGSILNPDSVISLPGCFISKAAVGDPAVYGGMDGLALVLSINNGPDITITFVGNSLTPASVVNQIQAAFTTANVTAALAELVGDGLTQFQVRTVGVGQFQFIDIKSGTDSIVADNFGIGVGKRYAGISVYNNYITQVPQFSFPDPRGNLEELAIETSSVRVFLGTGSGEFRESLRDSAFCRGGEVADAAATTEGSVDVTTPSLTTGDALTVAVNGSSYVYTVGAVPPATFAALKAALEAAIPGMVASQGTVTNGLIMTTVAGGYNATIQIISGTGLPGILADLGIATMATPARGVSIEAPDDGNGDAFTSLLKFNGAVPEDFSTGQPPSQAVISGGLDLSVGPYPATFAGKKLIISDGNQEQTITFSSTVADENAIAAEINAVVGPAAGGKITASIDLVGPPTNCLVLTHSDSGTDSMISIVGGDAVAPLGLTAGPVVYGNPSYIEPGDELWIDGAYVGQVSEVAPGGATDTLRIGAQIQISQVVGTTWYVIAKNLPGGATRPDPDLVIDGNGDVVLKQEQVRDLTGAPIATANVIYVSYTAVRKDVTALATSPGLLTFDDTTQLESALAPINAENPLALGLFYALLNAPAIQVTGLGVDAVSADAPYGTLEAFTRAAEYLEGQEVYAIAPLTHDETVHQLFSTHVLGMSEPEAKGERIALINPDIPQYRRDTLVASGTDGFTTGAGGTTFDTKVAALASLLQGAGVSPVGIIPTSAGVFLDIGSDAKKYSVSAIAGSIVTIRTTFLPGENDDNFYATTDLNDPPLPAALVDEAFSIKIRGAALATATGRDLNGIAETLAAIGSAYRNRRLCMTVPDQCAGTVEGSEQLLEGFYMNAALAGMIGQNPPQQSFTNFPISGFTRVIGSNDTFNERQMNIMAGGGAWIIIQEAAGAPLTSRMALTTDLTSIETRTDSITKVVDFTAKMLRVALRNFIGRFNITQGFLDSLGSVVEGVGGTLVETGVLIGFNLNNIVQDEDAPDTVLIDVTLDPPYPCNYIRLTLVI